MCLVLNDVTEHIAIEDIITYKVIAITNGVMHAVWQLFEYKYHKLYKLSVPLRTYTLFNFDTVTIDGFYSFNNWDDAWNLHLHCVNKSRYTTKVVECILPKGTEYYTTNNTIVSNQIIIKHVFNNK